MADKFPDPEICRAVRFVLGYNSTKPGEVRGATVALVHPEPEEGGVPLVNLNVVVGAPSDFQGAGSNNANLLICGVKFDPAKSPGTWHWPEVSVRAANKPQPVGAAV